MVWWYILNQSSNERYILNQSSWVSLYSPNLSYFIPLIATIEWTLRQHVIVNMIVYLHATRESWGMLILFYFYVTCGILDIRSFFKLFFKKKSFFKLCYYSQFTNSFFWWPSMFLLINATYNFLFYFI